MIPIESRVHARWLTGKGPGALSVLKVSGKTAWSLLRAGFRSVTNASLPEIPACGSAWLGAFPDSRGRGDQVLLLWRESGGVGYAEIQSHHGVLADKVLANRMVTLGIPLGDSEFLRNGETDFASSRTLFEREKLFTLAHCPNRIWLERVFCWSEHDWPKAISSIRSLIVSGDWNKAKELVIGGLSLAPLTTRMVRPFEILIAGPPNAGKSSLLNRLVGFERAIVSPIAGTTRDLVTGQISLGGWLVNLTDSAGLRVAEDPLEAQGIQKAMGQRERVDLVIWVSDVTSQTNSGESLDFPWKDGIGRSNPPLLVQNKVDMVPEVLNVVSGESHQASILLSAKSGLGVDRLLEAIGQKLGLCEFPKGLPIPFTSCLIGCLDALLDLIKREMSSEALQLINGWGVPSLLKENE